MKDPYDTEELWALTCGYAGPVLSPQIKAARAQERLADAAYEANMATARAYLASKEAA